MPDFTPHEDSIQFDSAIAKAKRKQEAEKIRQDFIKNQRLPSGAAATQRSIPESTEDER